MLAVLHVLGLVALLALPLALLVGRAVDWHLERVGHAFRVVTPFIDRWYPWAIACVTVWLAIGIGRLSLALHHSVEAAVLWTIVAGCLAVARSHPLAGPIGCLLLNYTFGRDDTVTVTFIRLGATSWTAALSVVATLAWANRQAKPLSFPTGWLAWCAAAFFASLGVAIVAATLAGRAFDGDLPWRAARNCQALALFFVAAMYRPRLRDLRIMVLALAAALVVRQVFLTSYWLMEQNLAMLAVVTVPIAVALAFCRPKSPLQVPLAIAGTYLAAMILFVQNRGAVVGLAAACGGLWPLARRRWLGLLVLASLPVAAGYWAFDAGLLDRFQTVYDGQRFLGTAAQRLEIWRSGLLLAREHLVLGVGPGNFEVALSSYTQGTLGLGAHNSLVELAVEAGLPALLLYLFVFVAAIYQLARVARRFPSDWRRTAAAGLLGSIAAHVAAGMFLSNPSLVWTWILLGVAVSLSHTPESVSSSV